MQHPGDQLSARQHHAIFMMLAGTADTAIAYKLSVHRSTIWRWKRTDAAFVEELRRRRCEFLEAEQDRLRVLLHRSITEMNRRLRRRSSDDRFGAASLVVRVALEQSMHMGVGGMYERTVALSGTSDMRIADASSHSEKVGDCRTFGGVSSSA
jgi:hypothetical protein